MIVTLAVGCAIAGWVRYSQLNTGFCIAGIHIDRILNSVPLSSLTRKADAVVIGYDYDPNLYVKLQVETLVRKNDMTLTYSYPITIYMNGESPTVNVGLLREAGDGEMPGLRFFESIKKIDSKTHDITIVAEIFDRNDRVLDTRSMHIVFQDNGKTKVAEEE